VAALGPTGTVNIAHVGNSDAVPEPGTLDIGSICIAQFVAIGVKKRSIPLD
jgi:hypothetical protein